MLSDLRRMRIIPWKHLGTNEPGYTLVIEWFKNGKCLRDECRQMDKAEFEALAKSVREALDANAI